MDFGVIFFGICLVVLILMQAKGAIDRSDFEEKVLKKTVTEKDIEKYGFHYQYGGWGDKSVLVKAKKIVLDNKIYNPVNTTKLINNLESESKTINKLKEPIYSSPQEPNNKLKVEVIIEEKEAPELSNTSENNKISISIERNSSMLFPKSVIRTNEELSTYVKCEVLKVVDYDHINISGNYISVIRGVKIVDSSLIISSSSLCDLGDIIEVNGDLSLSKYTLYRPKLKTLGKIKKVSGNVSTNISLEDLGELTYVGGNLSLNSSSVRDLGRLAYVGGNLNLNIDLKGKIDLKDIEIKGRVSYRKPYQMSEHTYKSRVETNSNIIPYWRPEYIYSKSAIDSVGGKQKIFYYDIFKPSFYEGKPIDTNENDNYSFVLLFDLIDEYLQNKLGLEDLQNKFNLLIEYYPKLEYYAFDFIIKELEKAKKHRISWTFITKSDNSLRLERILEYSLKLNEFLITPELALKLVGKSALTQYGHQNSEAILEKFKFHFDSKIKSEANNNFWSLFLKNEKPLEGYSKEHYKKYIISDGSQKAEDRYNFYKNIDKDQEKQVDLLEKGVFPHLISKSIIDYLKTTFIESENLFRVEKGVNKIGEGSRWKSEKELYNLIKSEFSSLEVIFQASPNWLGRQSFDIYIPKKNIAIEYQGEQHYTPVDFFGGEAAFKATQKRDLKKQKLSIENDCILFVVDQGYSYEMLVEEINNAINSRGDKVFYPTYKHKKQTQNSKGQVIKFEKDLKIFDCKTEKLITLIEIEKIEGKNVKMDYFLKQDGVYSRYILDINKDKSKTYKGWKNILNLKTNKIERHNANSFAEMLNVNPNNVWNFFNGRQKIFNKNYEIISNNNLQST